MALVCWSGGCDSTVVLYRLLKDRAAGTLAEPVRALSFVCSQVPANREQHRAREALKARLKEQGHEFEHSVITIDTQGALQQFGLTQAAVWLNATQCLGEKEDLYTGYVHGDEFWQDAAKYRKLFKALQRAAGRKGAWQHPLRDTFKSQVIVDLYTAGLYDLVWWCSAADQLTADQKELGPLRETPCHDCCSCMTHDLTLWKFRYGGLPHEERLKMLPSWEEVVQVLQAWSSPPVETGS